MKQCASYEPLLDAFTEGDLFMEDMVWVQQHLNTCPDCQAYVDDLLTIRAAFPTVEETEVPEGFAERVMAAVAATPQTAIPTKSPPQKSAKGKTYWAKMLAPLAACCAIVILAQSGLKLASGGSAAESAPAAEAPMEMALVADTAMPEAVAEETKAEPEAAVGGAKTAESPYCLSITVDAEYIGDLLAGYTPITTYDGGETAITEYALTLNEYHDLLTKLADREELPAEEVLDSDAELVLVLVRS